MSKRDCRARGWSKVGACLVAAMVVAACGESHAPDGDDVARVQLALVQVPTGVACIGVTVTPSGGAPSEQKFTVAAGQASTMTISPLLPGLVTFDAKAYGVACSSVTATSPALWIGSPVAVLLGAGQTVPVTLTLRRAPSASVSVDFCGTQPCGTVSVLANAGATVKDLALGGGRVFFTDLSGIYSVPVDGGDVAPLAVSPSASLRDGAAFDGSSIYTVRQAADGSNQLVKTAMSNGAETILTSSNVYGLPQTAAGFVYFLNSTRTFLLTMAPTAGAIARAVASDGPFQGSASQLPQVRPYVVDDVTIYYTVPGAIRIGTFGGQLGGNLYTALSGEVVTALATDGRHLYFGTRGSSVTSLKRIPVGGGPVEVLATDTTFGANTWAILRIVLDASAVYWTTLQVPPTGFCTGVGLSSRPLTGVATATQLFTTTAACGLDLVADASNLYLTAGRQVIRVMK